MATAQLDRERFHFLDGLRGIASLMIVFHHAFTSSICRWLDGHHLPAAGFYLRYFTQSGVDLFFVLSGVVLLRPYLRGERKFKTLEYLVRRIKRIYPAYWVALLFGALVCGYINDHPNWYNKKVYHMVFYWPEIIREGKIIDFIGAYYNLAWWSLGVEMLFYFLVPLIIIIFPRNSALSKSRVLILILGTFIGAAILQIIVSKHFPDIYSTKHLISNSYQIISYPVCFLMGILLAARDFSLADAAKMMLTGTALIIGSYVYLPLINPGYGLLYAGIITTLFHRQSLRAVLSHPFMIWLGERSYSLFLVHFSVFYLADSIVANYFVFGSWQYGLLSRMLGLPLALLVAMMLFTFVERFQARGLITDKQFWPWQAWKKKN